jgi:hypothetical protein
VYSWCRVAGNVLHQACNRQQEQRAASLPRRMEDASIRKYYDSCSVMYISVCYVSYHVYYCDVY